jgi:outer membrane protein TolC
MEAPQAAIHGAATTSVQVRTASVAQAEAAHRILVDRYEKGMSTLTDVLQVEAEVANQRTALWLAEVDVARASLQLNAATGTNG